ncbi:unnamed protein product, partial [Staurois parvus]
WQSCKPERLLLSFSFSPPPPPSIGRKLNKKCCYNGGTCFLGTLCICPVQFYGRHCEFEKWPADCPGGILNAEWVIRDCSLCRCLSGELYCLLPVPECGK